MTPNVLFSVGFGSYPPRQSGPRPDVPSNSNALALALNVEPGEGGRLALLWTQSFFIGISLVSYYSASSALFLSAYGSETLPYVYIAAAFVSTLTGLAYLRIQDRMAFSTVLLGNSAILLASVVVLRLSLDAAVGPWPAFLLLSWYPVMHALEAVTLWDTAGRLFDVRQSKRLFGLVGAGELMAMVIGGVSTPLLVHLVGTPNLLIFSACGLLLSLAVTAGIIKFYGQHLSANVERLRRTDEADSGRLRDMFKRRYVVLLFTLYFLVTLVSQLVDFLFYDQARHRFENENALANYFGLFSGVTQAVTLILVAFVTGRFISRFGIKIGMRLRPIVLLGAGIALAIIALRDTMPATLFAMTTMAKFFDLLLFRSFSGPSFLVLYQPLRPKRKFTVQVAIESMVGPIAGGLIGCLLLGLSWLGALETNVISVIIVGLIGVWIFTGKKTYAFYRQALSEALVQRILEGGSSIYDESMIDILKDRLASRHPGEVIYALDLLDKVEDESSQDHYRELLEHPSTEVRKEVLDRIRREMVVDRMEDVRVCVNEEDDDEVKAHALRALCALGESDVLDEVFPHIEHPDPVVRRGVISGMLRYGGIDGVLTAGGHLIRMETSENPEDRVFTAQVLGDVGITSFYRPLIRLLRDEVSEVRVAALMAAGEVRSPRLWPLVLSHLASPRYHPYAAKALVRGGTQALSAIQDVLGGDDYSREVKVRAASACGRMGGQRSINLLYQHMSVPDRTIRRATLHSLHHLAFRAEAVQIVGVRREIWQELSDITWLLGARADVAGSASCELLVRAIDYELDQTRRRVILLLSFLYDSRTIMRAEENLSHHAAQQRAYALEVLETTLTRDLCRLVFPVLEWDQPQDCLVALSEQFPQPRATKEDRLSELLGEQERWVSPWVRSCALYALKEEGGQDGIEVAKAFVDDGEPLIRETALWVTGERKRVRHPSDTEFGEQAEESPMLLTIERVLVLKSVKLFEAVPEEVLAALAAVMEERECRAGEAVYEKGGTGRSMYIIAEGEVRVHDGDRTFVTLGEREFFGELTTLDPAPHSANVSTNVATRLLVLDREGLYELMSDHPEVLREIIHELCGRLRRK